MTRSVTDFYADLTPFYHLLYPDWEKSIERQARMLDAVIRERWGKGIRSVLDAACGIGTQSLGLAQLGYQVSGSDLSPDAVDRARKEAAARKLKIPFASANMRDLRKVHQTPVDLVIACDNALPHLLNDAEILDALREFLACLRPGGGCLISVRDYEAEERGKETAKVYGSREEDGVRYLIFQVWNWKDDLYDLSLYFITDEVEKNPRVQVMRSTYYTIGTSQLLDLMGQAGFVDLERLDKAYFQPLLLGRRPE